MGNQRDNLDRAAERSRSERELQGLTRMLLAAQEDERRRIAADLHDGIGQCLSAAQFAIGGVKQQIRDRLKPAEEEKLDCIQENLARAVEEVRRIAMDIRPPMLDDLGIASAIDWFCADLRKMFTNFDVIQSVCAEEDAIPAPVKEAIFRIVQEACNNACKYSRANRITVLLVTTELGTRLEIVDDGVGFNPNAMQGFGLASMRERAKLTNGRLVVRSQPGEGTRILAAWGELEPDEISTTQDGFRSSRRASR